MTDVCNIAARHVKFVAIMLLCAGNFLPPTMVVPKILCEAFVVPGGSQRRWRTKTRETFSKRYRHKRRCNDERNTLCSRGGSDDDESRQPDSEGKRILDRGGSNRNRPKKHTEMSRQQRINSGNPSRREFVSTNSILAGLVSAVGASTSGASAAELLFSKDKKSEKEADPPPLSNTESYRSSNTHMEDGLEPFSTVRKYKSLTLANGMKVLLVNDKYAFQSSAALTVNGAGQFSDPTYVTGLAHLMEHIVLSSRPGTTWSNQGDFQEWLDGDYAEGFSNGFTAYEKVCFHFQCKTDVFAEALVRFSNLFLQKNVEQNCRSREAVRREIRRVDSELDKNDLFSREKYLTKSLINPKHPYAKMTLGSIETLETLPAMADINVSEELYNFFQENYQPEQAILVVVSSASLSSLENMVQPFAVTMSKQKNVQFSGNTSSRDDKDPQKRQENPFKRQQRIFPPFLLPGKPIRPICLFRRKVTSEILADNLEKLSFQWALDQDYSGLRQPTDFLGNSISVVTATQIGFVMAEILGRRGPGSLHRILKKRKWISEGRGIPRISFPVDVSGFQIMRLEIVLTLEGFEKRSSVIAAVFDCLSCLRSNPPSRELIAQFCAVAQLYGHLLAPRAPDAIELAFDGQIYGIDGPKGVGIPQWRLLPLPDNTLGVQALQRTMQSVLTQISDPSNAITIVTASQRAIISQKRNDLEEPFPLFSPASWDISPTTQARYLAQNNALTGKINEWLVARITEEKLAPPDLNPLIPSLLRPPRVTPSGFPRNALLTSYDSNNGENVRQIFASVGSETYDTDQPSVVRDYWELLRVYSHHERLPPPGLTLPNMPPEPSSRSVFVLQLLSARPRRASAESSAYAEVWRISLESALADLAELGAPAGLAYDISYNNYGMRVAFLGLSQNLASYSREIACRMIDHTNQLLEGPDEFPPQILEAAIRNTNRYRMNASRKQQICSVLRQTTALDAAREGTAFFRSCGGAVCFSQGDLLPAESLAILADLKDVFRKMTGTNVRPSPAIPEVGDLLYRANWIPRAGSVCTIPGAILVSNPCGRVPR